MPALPAEPAGLDQHLVSVALPLAGQPCADPEFQAFRPGPTLAGERAAGLSADPAARIRLDAPGKGERKKRDRAQRRGNAIAAPPLAPESGKIAPGNPAEGGSKPRLAHAGRSAR